MQAVKERFVKLLGVGAPEDVAVTPSTSYALSLVAASVHLRPGQQIVVLEAQSASNVMQWQACVERCPGSVFTVVDRPTVGSEAGWTDDVVAAILARDTAVVALPNVHWTDGWALHLETISETCRQAGALLCLDLTQSLGVLPFNGLRVRPAVVACSVHKWLHGAHGFSLLYVDPKGLLPPPLPVSVTPPLSCARARSLLHALLQLDCPDTQFATQPPGIDHTCRHLPCMHHA
eukprot:Tamp_21329.p1 GENE.Tamp_21329~~Tamp_21329.p1  ORF type:complete len:241 (-),score=26.85 Tamp_21329:427-1125(-)